MKKMNYQLDKRLKTPLYLQLYQQIRSLIDAQALRLGDKLPSKRSLCDYLQISQNTVEAAYAQLLAEGYIESLPRRGFFVCFQPAFFFSAKKEKKTRPQTSAPTPIHFDFNPNYIDTERFPIASWRKAGKGLFQHRNQDLLGLGEKQGDSQLRHEICDYLFSSRGVKCDIEQIVICAGLESVIQQLILLFDHLYSHPVHYGMERYGYQTLEELLKLYHKTIIKLPLKQNSQQLDLNFLQESSIDIACVTPSHLYPFGHVLSVSQRQQLLEWAREKPHRYIIEDDYDSEFRYKGKPIPALQSLDKHGSVIYLGSFSKLLMPSLRLSFMVLPKSLVPLYQQYCGFMNCSVSRFEQQRLAIFIQQGDFEKHINRMRKLYRRKMELLCSLLAPYRHQISYYGEHSGFYLLIELLKETRSLSDLSALALTKGVKVYPVSCSDRKLFSLGFGNLSEMQIQQGVEHLLQAWFHEKGTN
ncbi:PLP-dependent aminotransferase family protein [Pasteurella sp. PK-2025]|uniref:MocR-like pyridoxine biosynthesis transcription factor PdxR n=1 Tax=Pasteurella sp. PK-2025 TaxID=3413133 RepID=UPI003C70AAAF